MTKQGVTLSIEQDVWNAFKIHAIEQKVNASTMVESFMREKISKEKRGDLDADDQHQ